MGDARWDLDRPQPLERCRAALAESRAKAAADGPGQDSKHSSVAGHAEEWRMWELPSPADCALYLEFLTTYTSAGNASPGGTVRDPLIAGEKLAGVWRQVVARKRRVNGRIAIVQGLRRVYAPKSAEELAALPWRRGDEGKVLHGDEGRFVWEDLDPENRATFMGLPSASVLSAMELSGEWGYLDRAFDHHEANVARGIFTLKYLRTPASVVALAALENRRLKGNEVLKLFGLWEGDGNSLAIVWADLAPAYESAFMGYSAADLTSAASPGAGWEYADRKFEVDERNCGSAIVLWKKVTWTNFDSGTGRPTRHWLDGIENPGGWGKSHKLLAPGVPVDNAEASVANALAGTGYILEGSSFSESSPGEVAVRVAKAAIWDYDAGEGAVSAPSVVRWRPSAGRRQRQSVTGWWPMVNPTRIDAVVAAAKDLTKWEAWFTGQLDTPLDGFVLAVTDVFVDRHPGGAATVRGTVGQVEDWPASGGESWSDTGDVIYTLKVVRDSYGEPIRKITYATQEIRRYFHHHCTEFIAAKNASIAPKMVLEGKTWIRRDGHWKYTARLAWIELEEDLTAS